MTTSLPTRVAVASATAQYANNTEFGEPADADASDDFLVRRPEYTASYSQPRGTPNWVSYNLEATHFGAEDRCDCFTFDPELPASFTRYTTADYTGAGAFHGFGIDRGHLARSFDRTSGSLDNARTFYFTNIIPQAADQNQGPWAAMESFLGDLARFQNKEVYLIAGPAGSQGTVKNEGRITIPASVWKVALILPHDHRLADVDGYEDVEVMAVVMPNEAGVRNVDWRTYRVTVDEVEAASGYDVLALLPDPVEHVIESGVGDVERLVDQLVAAGALDDGNANALRVTVEAAAVQIARGNTVAALNQVRAFLNAVEALVRSGRLGTADADALRAVAAAVIRSAS